MTEHQAKVTKLAELISLYTQHDGLTNTQLEELNLIRYSGPTERTTGDCQSALVIYAQGRKGFYLDGARFTVDAGNSLVLCRPMGLEHETIEASENEPLLGLQILLHPHRLAKLILKIDTLCKQEINTPYQAHEEIITTTSSGIIQSPPNYELLGACIRLVACLQNPDEASVLGDLIIDEIYYRLLTDAQSEELTALLRTSGQLQHIFKAVNYLQKNLYRNVSIEELAAITHMSASGLHKKFKEVMQLSPLQYVKLMRLNRARSYIAEGKNIAEAAHAVGYNSPAQFSREYKRQFGTTPSDKDT